jgi:prolyl-tRNA editing enzyme YbaK/EbsC (Cys-tRNA(Pro) deacylase)
MDASRTPDDVREALKPHGVEVRRLDADTSTAVLAAEALGTTVGSIAKSLLFMADDRPVLVIASGDRTVDAERLKGITGANRVRLAKPAEVLATTGYRVGGVPPLAHARPVHLLMDRTLLTFPTVFAAAGAPDAIFPISPHRLREIAEAEVVDVVKGG